MRAGSLFAVALRSLAFAILLSVVAVGAPGRALAQETSGQFRTDLARVQADMRALRAEAEQFRVLASYCKPPRLPDKERDEQTLADLSRRADEINRRYQQLKTNLRQFLQHSPRAAAELMINDADPQADRWWRSYEADRARMFDELNRKRAALTRAPVRDCGPRTQPQAQPQTAATPQAPSQPQAPTYPQVTFPTVPTHFCSEEEYWRFLTEVINPQYNRAAENAEAAARFRSQVEQAVNAHVQAGRPVPADLRALRARAHREFAEQQRLSDEIARLRDRMRRTPIIDCSKKEPSHGSLLPPPSRYGPVSPNSLHALIYGAYSDFMDARQRCDLAVMNREIAELERHAREAKEAYDGIAMGMQGPFDQEPSPENLAFWAAEADMKAAQRLLDRARRERASCPCDQIVAPPVRAVVPPVAPPARPVQDAQRSVVRFVEYTDSLFEELARAVQAKDCARIQELVAKIGTGLDRSGKAWWAVVPPQLLVKWRFVFLKARETCRPQRDEPESILDDIDEVPVIALAPAAPPDAVSAALLAYHNRLRDEVGSVALRWNSMLAANAATQARVIAESGQLQHASREGRQRTERENLSLSVHGANSPMAMVQTWGGERSLYRGGTFPNVCAGDWSQCAHYTQMVWSTTTDVGCAFVQGRRFDALVCRYSPPGNRDGRPVTGVSPVQSVNPCPPALGWVNGGGAKSLEGR